MFIKQIVYEDNLQTGLRIYYVTVSNMTIAIAIDLHLINDNLYNNDSEFLKHYLLSFLSKEITSQMKLDLDKFESFLEKPGANTPGPVNVNNLFDKMKPKKGKSPAEYLKDNPNSSVANKVYVFKKNKPFYQAPPEAPKTPQITGFTQLKEQIPALETFLLCCPICQSNPEALSRVIIHLNDVHHWLRESIADWLDTLDVNLNFKGETDD